MAEAKGLSKPVKLKSELAGFLGATEQRLSIYEYPDFPFEIIGEITNFEIN